MLLEAIGVKEVGFLDLAHGALEAPAVRWTAYSSDLGIYQGELVNKEKYTKHFFEAAGKDGTYDLAKLSYLWEHILAACSL